MFFWVVLGSLISLITWGKISENARSPDNHVVPVYETLVSSLSVQNKIASEYVQMKSAAYEKKRTAIGSSRPVYPTDSGTVFSVTNAGKINPETNAELAAGGAYAKSRYNYIKLASGFKTGYYCVKKNAAAQVITKTEALAENQKCYLGDGEETGLFVITFGRGIGTYSTANLQYFFKAVERAEPGAKNMGVLKRAYVDGSGVHEKTSGNDDEDTLYWIYAVGRSVNDAVFLPKGVVSAMKTAEGLDSGGSLEGYYVLLEALRHKGVSCLLTPGSC